MRRTPIPAAFILVTALSTLTACERDPVAPALEGLVGVWRTAEQALERCDGRRCSPAGSFLRELEITGSATYRWEVRTMGSYRDQEPSELSSYHRELGTARIDADRLVLEADVVESWDAFHGGSPQVSEPTGSPFEARVSLFGNSTLVLSYLTFPADAPVPTQLVLRRVR